MIKNQYRYDTTIWSVFILLRGLSVHLVIIIKKKKELQFI